MNDNQPTKILLVEDNPGDARLVRELLSQGSGNRTGLRFELTHVERLDQALRALDQEEFGLILLDLSLPDSQGLATMQQMIEAAPNLPLIVLSGLGDESLALEAVKAGAEDYLVKTYVDEYSLPRAIRYGIERKRARESLRRSEAFNRAVLSSLTAHIAVLDREGYIVAVNQAWEWFARQNGDPEFLHRGIGINYLQVCRQATGLEAQEAGAVLSGIRDVSAGAEEEFSLEYPCHSPTEKRWFLMRVTPLRDGQGSVVVSHENITERRQAAENVRRRNRELALLNRIIAASVIDSEPAAILETACRELGQFFGLPQVTADLLNPAKTEVVIVAEQLTGDRQSVLGTTIPIAKIPSFQDMVRQKEPLVITDAQRDPRLASIRPMLQAYQTASLLILPLRHNEEILGSLNLATTEPHDFSEEEISLAWRVADQVAGVLARANLTQTQRLLTAAVEQSTESVIITDTEGSVLYVNPAFEQISGYSQSEIVGHSSALLRGENEDTAIYDKMGTAIRAGQAWQGRVNNRRKDGSHYPTETSITPLRDENGTVSHYVGLQRDMTRELQLEEQYRQSQKMEAIGQLTAGIAHDFNNLLTAINGFAELLQLRYGPDQPQQHFIDNILHSGQRAAALIQQLMAFSRKQIIDPKVLNLNEVVRDIDTMLRRIIGEDVRMKTNLSPDLWSTRIDPAQMQQVILNLAVNARDAMPEGGQLTIETANVVLDDDYLADHLHMEPGEHVLLSLSDTGLGMSEAVTNRIFEPFFTTKEQGKGTGLGLATVFGIVKQSGGNIWVYSEEGLGTTFKIYLPRADQQAPQPEKAISTSEEVDSLAGNETILLVEDDPALRGLLEETLQGQGYQILPAPNGSEALDLVSQHGQPIHLLLTDVVMPGLNGRMLAEQLNAIRPEIKVLFMSGYTDEVISHHGVLDPGVHILQKPFGRNDLAREVRAVLDNSQSHFQT